jgi:hypothetical protein
LSREALHGIIVLLAAACFALFWAWYHADRDAKSARGALMVACDAASKLAPAAVDPRIQPNPHYLASASHPFFLERDRLAAACLAQ